MDGDHPSRARALVEEVNVLGNHGGQSALRFKPGKEAVGEGGLDTADQTKEITGELVEGSRIPAKGADLEDRLGIIAAGDIKPLRPAEVRDPGSRGDTGAGEGDNRPRAADEFGASPRVNVLSPNISPASCCGRRSAPISWRTSSGANAHLNLSQTKFHAGWHQPVSR